MNHHPSSLIDEPISAVGYIGYVGWLGWKFTTELGPFRVDQASGGAVRIML